MTPFESIVLCLTYLAGTVFLLAVLAALVTGHGDE